MSLLLFVSNYCVFWGDWLSPAANGTMCLQTDTNDESGAYISHG